jgi:signal transduction histidine kinase
VTAWERAHRLPHGAEIVLAFATGAGTFALVAVVLAGIDARVGVALLGVVYLFAVIAVARQASIAYAVPVAMAGMLAYDWYYLPPTHPLEFPDSANLVDLTVYLGVAVLLGELAAHAARRAEAAERARGEIADVQAALRRVATLVARGAPAHELFAAVAAEAGILLDVHGIRIARYEGETELVHVAEWSKPGYEPPAYDRAKLEGTSVSAEVLRTGRAARIDDYEDIAVRAPFARGVDAKSVVGAPVVVEDRRWGVMIAWSGSGPLPSEMEGRLTDFAELIATAISNTDARTGIARLADEQAALRRMATLVAREAQPLEVFAKVTEEVGGLLGADLAVLIRYEAEDRVNAIVVWAAAGDPSDVEARWPIDGEGLAATILRTGRPARQDGWDGVPGAFAAFAEEYGIRSSVGSPIVVERRVWGALFVHSKQLEPLRPDIESRLSGFSELVATSMASAQARAEVGRLADEQAAMRRVATLVAKAVPTAEVFEGVTREVGLQCDADLARMERFEPDRTVTAVAAWSRFGETQLAVGERFALEGESIAAQVLATGQPARVDTFMGASGPIAREAQALGIRASVGCPIVVGRRTWGVIAASTRREAPFPPNTESRIADFTELVATAVSNADARTELLASRARLLTAGDDACRRVSRDLHDGAQQSLVALALRLRSGAAASSERGEIRTEIADAAAELMGAIDDLREISRGIHPTILSTAGLGPALRALGRRSAVPVEMNVRVDGRLSEPVEVGAYYVVSEMLANAAKHARASVVEVDAEAFRGTLKVRVRDNGIGGADPARGSGLLGLKDRIEALGGTFSVHSPVGRGTTASCELPIMARGGCPDADRDE